MIVKMLEVGMLSTNCYLVMDAPTREGYIIDAGAEARRILEAARGSDMKCLAVLCTHGHVDHVAAAGKVAGALCVPVMISSQDSGGISGGALSIGARLSSMAVSRPREGFEYLEGESELPMGSSRLRVVETPGHTRGSVSFVADGQVFCGDLVFQGSVGRTDLRGGSMEQLVESVAEHIFTLPPEAKIWPGHGPATTVAAEMSGNPFLRGISRGA